MNVIEHVLEKIDSVKGATPAIYETHSFHLSSNEDIGQ